ncbi:MAG TPA: YdeI/OmpD-associated family protein [Thermoanaerobaculia bacterium]|nr:YdeI/OmpD-associated family protein [Thermoanaerobaculia bacterium]
MAQRDPVYFASAAEFRAWLEAHHADETEVLVGFFKRGARPDAMTWPESVDEALCYGWIDGVRKRVDDERYTIRFTPRRAKSIWSAVNLRRVEELKKEKRMQPAGLRAYENRDVARAKQYSFEQDVVELGAEREALFRSNDEAWAFFSAQAPSYRRVASWWVISAKQEATRDRRMAKLIEHSAAGERVPQFVSH